MMTHPPATSTSRCLSFFKSIASTAKCSLPGLTLLASRAGATYYMVQEINNYVHKEDQTIEDDWKALLGLAVVEASVITVAFITRFLVMMKSSNDQANQAAVEAIPAENSNTENMCRKFFREKMTPCRAFFNPVSFNTESFQAGFIGIQSLTLVYAGQLVLHSSLSADSYVTGNNFSANVVWGAFCWAGLRALTKYGLLQNEIFYKDIIIDKGYHDITPYQYTIATVSSGIFGCNVFFLIAPSLKKFEQNTLATFTDYQFDDNTSYSIAGFAVLSSFVNNLITVLSAYYRESHPNLAKENVPLKLPYSVESFVKLNILLNALYFGVCSYISIATLPGTIQKENYSKLNYHIGLILSGIVAGTFNSIATVIADLRSFSYAMETLGQPIKRDAVVVVSSNRYGKFDDEVREKLLSLQEASSEQEDVAEPVSASPKA